MTRLEELKQEYWKVMRHTRKSGKISQNIMNTEEAFWSQYPDAIVAAALREHISRHRDYKERYTRGIIRNMNAQKGRRGSSAAPNSFHDFKQNEYDFEQLEKDLLAN